MNNPNYSNYNERRRDLEKHLENEFPGLVFEIKCHTSSPVPHNHPFSCDEIYWLQMPVRKPSASKGGEKNGRHDNIIVRLSDPDDVMGIFEIARGVNLCVYESEMAASLECFLREKGFPPDPSGQGLPKTVRYIDEGGWKWLSRQCASVNVSLLDEDCVTSALLTKKKAKGEKFIIYKSTKMRNNKCYRIFNE